MKWWNNVKSKRKGTGINNRRLSELLGTDTLDGDSEGDAVVPERGGDSTRTPSERQLRPIPAEASAQTWQFINGHCKICGHPRSIHFIETDSMGYYAFCSISICECWVDERVED